MRCRLLASLFFGTGLVCAAYALAPARAQDKGNKPESGSAKDHEEGGEESSSRKLEKALHDYQDRSARDLEQTRKDLDRMRKELSELIDLRIDMAISAAELRAAVGTPGMSPGYPGAPGIMGAPTQFSPGYPSPGMGSAGAGSEADRQHRRAAALNQELRQVQDALRSEIQQTRSQTDQLVTQVRLLRAQHRQREEMIKANRERNREREKENKPSPEQNKENKSSGDKDDQQNKDGAKKEAKS